MVSVNDIMLCIGVTHSPELGVTAHAITDVLRPRDVKTPFNFASIIPIKGVEPGKEYKLKVRIIDPEMEEIACTEGMLPPKPVNGVPMEYQCIQCAITWQGIVLNSSGVFTMQVFIDDEMLKVHEIYVAEAPQQPVNPNEMKAN